MAAAPQPDQQGGRRCVLDNDVVSLLGASPLTVTQLDIWYEERGAEGGRAHARGAGERLAWSPRPEAASLIRASLRGAAQWADGGSSLERPRG
jgi:hypothetical protein